VTTAAQIQTKVDKFVVNMDRLDSFVNANNATDVTIDSGTIPSLAKFRVELGLATRGGVNTTTWAQLAALTGVYNGQGGKTLVDAGTHTDPVVGGTVPNQGLYAWSSSPAGWKRIGADPYDTLGTMGAQNSNAIAVTGGTASGLTTLAVAAAAKVATLDGFKVNGADIASAATIDLDAATGDFVNVSGNVDISTVTLSLGKERWVRFLSTLTLIHSTNLFLNGNGANIAIGGNDRAHFRGYPSGVVRCHVNKANGRPIVATVAADISDSSTAGRAMLTAATSIVQTALLNLVDDTTKGLMSPANFTKLGLITGSADVTNVTTVAAAIVAAASKTTPVGADTLALIDSAASNALKELTIDNLKAFLKAANDLLYEPMGTSAGHAMVTAAGPAAQTALLAIANTTDKGLMSSTDKTKLDSITSGAQVNTVTSVAGKTGVVALVKADVGLSAVDNTADLAKPISTAAQTAIDTKASTASVVAEVAARAAADTALDVTKANLASPTFTGTVGGITKTMVGLANVDNTTDAGKPVSSATQAALSNKQPLSSVLSGTTASYTSALDVKLGGIEFLADVTDMDNIKDAVLSGTPKEAPSTHDHLVILNSGNGLALTSVEFGSLLADSAQTLTGTDTGIAVTPKGLADTLRNYVAETVKVEATGLARNVNNDGLLSNAIVRITVDAASGAETAARTITNKAVTPGGLDQALDQIDSAVAELTENLEVGLRDARSPGLYEANLPGDIPDLFTQSLEGDPPPDLAVIDPALIEYGEDGPVIRIVGESEFTSRKFFNMRPNRVYRARVEFRRHIDSPDPAGATIRVGLSWYDRFKNRLPDPNAFTIVQDFTATPVTVASGLKIVECLVARFAGVDGRIVAPTGAVFCKPYIQGYENSTHQIDYELVDWEDVTNAVLFSPDVTDLLARTTALESIDTDPRLTDLEVAIGTPDTRWFGFLGDAEAATIPMSVDRVVIFGEGPNENVMSRYVRDATGDFQSVDGQWWKLDLGITYLRSLDTVSMATYMSAGDLDDIQGGADTDVTAAYVAAQTKVGNGGEILFPGMPGAYIISAEVVKKPGTWLRGPKTNAATDAIGAVIKPGHNGKLFSVAGTAINQRGGIEGIRFLRDLVDAFPASIPIYLNNVRDHMLRDCYILNFVLPFHGVDCKALYHERLYTSGGAGLGGLIEASDPNLSAALSSDHWVFQCQFAGALGGLKFKHTITPSILQSRPQGSGVSNLILEHCLYPKVQGHFNDSARVADGAGILLDGTVGATIEGITFYTNGPSHYHIEVKATDYPTTDLKIGSCLFLSAVDAAQGGVKFFDPGANYYRRVEIYHNNLFSMATAQRLVGLEHIDRSLRVTDNVGIPDYVVTGAPLVDVTLPPEINTYHTISSLDTFFNLRIPGAGHYQGKKYRIIRGAGGIQAIPVFFPDGSIAYTMPPCPGEIEVTCSLEDNDPNASVWRLTHVEFEKEGFKGNVIGNADITLIPFVDSPIQRVSATLTGNRLVALGTANAVSGMRWRIIRVGGGAFNLNINNLIDLRQHESATLVWDDQSTIWRVEEYGPIVNDLEYTGSTIADADITLNPFNPQRVFRAAAALSGNRIVTLPTSGVKNGVKYHISRSGGNIGGPWTLNIGGLILLAQNGSCQIVFESGVNLWRLINRGSTVSQIGLAGITNSYVGNADITLIPFADTEVQRETATLNGNRLITFDIPHAVAGSRFKVIRVGGNSGGPWTLSLGGLILLAQNEQGEVIFDGTAWQSAGKSAV
jgi:hypothetical protein